MSLEQLMRRTLLAASLAFSMHGCTGFIDCLKGNCEFQEDATSSSQPDAVNDSSEKKDAETYKSDIIDAIGKKDVSGAGDYGYDQFLWKDMEVQEEEAVHDIYVPEEQEIGQQLDLYAEILPEAAETQQEEIETQDLPSEEIPCAFTLYEDKDGDGFGNPLETIINCTMVSEGYSNNDKDCDDTNPTVYPGSVEQYDGIDNDCDGYVDESCNPLSLGDSCLVVSNDCYANGIVKCDAANNKMYCISYESDQCDGLDNDCDGELDEDAGFFYHPQYPCGLDVGECKAGVGAEFICTDGGWNTITKCYGAISPTSELCDLVDNDCDGLTDEFCPQVPTCIVKAKGNYTIDGWFQGVQCWQSSDVNWCKDMAQMSTTSSMLLNAHCNPFGACGDVTKDWAVLYVGSTSCKPEAIVFNSEALEIGANCACGPICDSYGNPNLSCIVKK